MPKTKATIEGITSNSKSFFYTNAIKSFNIFGNRVVTARRLSNRKKVHFKCIERDWEMVGGDISYASKKVMFAKTKKTDGNE